MDNGSSIIVDTVEPVSFIGGIEPKNKAWIILMVIVLIVVSTCYYKDGFISPDGIIAGKESRQGIRSDSHVDKDWNLKELEKVVAQINRS
jgi:hypothetical protein